MAVIMSVVEETVAMMVSVGPGNDCSCAVRGNDDVGGGHSRSSGRGDNDDDDFVDTNDHNLYLNVLHSQCSGTELKPLKVS